MFITELVVSLKRRGGGTFINSSIKYQRCQGPVYKSTENYESVDPLPVHKENGGKKENLFPHQNEHSYTGHS